MNTFSVSVAEETQEIEEEVDEIEIEAEGSQSGKAAVGHSRVGFCHLLDLLGVPGCDADEDKHSETAHDPVECGVCPEDIDHTEYDEAE